MTPRQQGSEDVRTLIRALVKLKGAARRERERDSLAAAAALEDAVAAAEKGRSIARAAQARECFGSNTARLNIQSSIKHARFLTMLFHVPFLLAGLLAPCLNRTLLRQLSLLSSYQKRQQPH
jgi:hypothetical protein